MKKSIKVALLSVLAVVVVLGVLAFLFWDNIINFTAKTLKTPEEYYVYVEEANLEKTASSIYALLNVDELTKDYKIGTNGSFKVETGEGMADVYKLLFGSASELEWLKSVEFKLESNGSKEISDGKLSGLLNGTEIISANFVVDSKNENMYFSVPLLTDKVIKISSEDMEDLYGTDLEDIVDSATGSVGSTSVFGNESMEKLVAAIPSEEVFTKILSHYIDVAVKNIDGVEKTSETLTINGVTQSCTVISYELDEADFRKIAKAVLIEVEKDKDIEKIIKDFAKALGEDENETYESFAKAVEEAIAELENVVEHRLTREKTVIRNYVGGSGKVVARQIKDDTSEFFIGNVRKGSDVATEIRFVDEFADEEESFKFSGKGIIKSNKLYGSYTIYENDDELLKIGVDKFDLKALDTEGKFSGEFSVSAGGRIDKLLDGMDKKVASFVESLKIKFIAGDNSGALEIYSKDKLCVKFAVKAEEKAYKAPVLPDESKVISVSDEEALVKALENFDPQTLIDKLKEAGLPEDLFGGMGGSADSDDSDIFEDYEDLESVEALSVFDDQFVA
ncbi:MAG: hypothetical protein E7614_01535 [Ruminococcaceae bacterium]|nr:hypothetical protein [Oscillospiraceae bacterium]